MNAAWLTSPSKIPPSTCTSARTAPEAPYTAAKAAGDTDCDVIRIFVLLSRKVAFSSKSVMGTTLPPTSSPLSS